MKTNTSEPEITTEVNNHFVSILQQFRHGESIHELSQALQVLTAAVRQTGKGGTLTYVIKIKPYDKTGDAVSITDEIKIKAPEDRETKVFFTTDDNLLIRDNPDQQEMAFREVQKDPVPVKDMTQPQQQAANVVAS